jgi:hypothetical protein
MKKKRHNSFGERLKLLEMKIIIKKFHDEQIKEKTDENNTKI